MARSTFTRLIRICLLVGSTTTVVCADENTSALIRTAVDELIMMQEEDGAWPYEGVYRVASEIPVGYRVGGTALIAEALLHAVPPSDKAAAAAIDSGVGFILEGLKHPLMKTSTRNAYDVRVWGHAFALEFFCQLRAAGRMGKHRDDIEKRIPRLVKTLVREEIPGGGWNYATRRASASFVTAPVTQALLLARSQGETVPDDVLERAKKVLLASRSDSGGFVYSGRANPNAKDGGRSQLPGAIARSPACETTLMLLGAGSTDAVRASLEAFNEHWGELEMRRKKTGTHMPPYAIAPYYFYYGHRYAAQAIEMLPREMRAKEQERLLKLILRTRDEDGTWNDRVFARSRNYGTAMVVLALLRETCPLPPCWTPASRPASRAATQPGRAARDGSAKNAGGGAGE